uniref:Adaptin ear-binding coat-associated protein 1 n=1 Tax=Oryctolagus cuniculus TaxID=9986 RepID=A0A5F9DP36_RABIT
KWRRAEYMSEPCARHVLVYGSVYQTPPWASKRGCKASDWNSNQGKTAYIKLQDKVSGALFAQAPIEQYPGTAVETVAGCSGYLVILLQDGPGGIRTPPFPGTKLLDNLFVASPLHSS